MLIRTTWNANTKQQKDFDDIRRDNDTKESDDIHQVMYGMATKGAATTLQLDPIGGSENFQGGSRKCPSMIGDTAIENESKEQSYKVLLSKLGGQMEGVRPKYSSQSIYECAHDWVSQGNMHTGDCKILRGILCKR